VALVAHHLHVVGDEALLEQAEAGARADVRAHPEAHAVRDLAGHGEDARAQEGVAGRAVRDRRVRVVEPVQFVVGDVDVVGEHAAIAEQARVLVGAEVVLRVREQLPDELDLARALLHVAGEAGGRVLGQQGLTGLEHRAGARHGEPGRDGVAQPAAVVPALDEPAVSS